MTNVVSATNLENEMQTMQALIEQADASRQPNANYSQAKAQTPQGLVRCYRDYSVYKAGMPRTIRTNWRLNDKVISADKLRALLA